MCPLVQVLRAATGKGTDGEDGDFHQDFFCWCCGWCPLGLVEDGEEILEVYTSGGNVPPLFSLMLLSLRFVAFLGQ